MFECKNVVVRNNIFARDGNSVKFSSDHYHGVANVVVENNLFFGNATGVEFTHSTGGPDYSHYNLKVHDNVFTHLGRYVSPTGEIGNGVREVTADGLNIAGNLFLRTHASGVSYPVVTDYRNKRNVMVENNVVFQWDYDPTKGPFILRNGAEVQNNLVDLAASQFVDASRTVASYHASIGGEASVGAFLNEARRQAKGNWRPKYTGGAVVQYMKAGFTLVPTFD